MKLTEILKDTIAKQYAVGSFTPRYENVIRPVLQAAQECRTPAIIQISSKELARYKIKPEEFAGEYFRQLKELDISVPTTLHLDHTYDFDTIKEAIDAGFESVMIDASGKPFEENVRITSQVVEYAHKRNVDVEAELGKIGANDQIETGTNDEELYTIPEEAKAFVERTGVDALAVSVGTAHGVYTVKQPLIQYHIIQEIKRLTPVYLVLHGGSGVPSHMVVQSYRLSGGGGQQSKYRDRH